MPGSEKERSPPKASHCKRGKVRILLLAIIGAGGLLAVLTAVGLVADPTPLHVMLDWLAEIHADRGHTLTARLGNATAEIIPSRHLCGNAQVSDGIHHAILRAKLAEQSGGGITAVGDLLPWIDDALYSGDRKKLVATSLWILRSHYSDEELKALALESLDSLEPVGGRESREWKYSFLERKLDLVLYGDEIQPREELAQHPLFRRLIGNGTATAQPEL